MTTLRITTCTLAASFLLLAGCTSTPPATPATPANPPSSRTEPQAAHSITPNPNEATESHAWTDEQILTCTVSQCWHLGGRTEDGYFDIIQKLAVISARNRNLTLPESEEAGRKAGEYIKAEAHKDRGQLLFAVVDGAVRKVGTPSPSN